MFEKLVAGNEKAIIGGLSAGILSLVGQIGINAQVTFKEGIYAVVAWVFTHILVYVSTNTPTPVDVPSPPTVIAPENPVTPDTTPQ